MTNKEFILGIYPDAICVQLKGLERITGRSVYATVTHPEKWNMNILQNSVDLYHLLINSDHISCLEIVFALDEARTWDILRIVVNDIMMQKLES